MMKMETDKIVDDPKTQVRSRCSWKCSIPQFSRGWMDFESH